MIAIVFTTIMTTVLMIAPSMLAIIFTAIMAAITMTATRMLAVVFTFFVVIVLTVGALAVKIEVGGTK